MHPDTRVPRTHFLFSRPFLGLEGICVASVCTASSRARRPARTTVVYTERRAKSNNRWGVGGACIIRQQGDAVPSLAVSPRTLTRLRDVLRGHRSCFFFSKETGSVTHAVHPEESPICKPPFSSPADPGGFSPHK